MGAPFNVNHANFVAYLTADDRPTPPRTDAWNLREFLLSLQYGGDMNSTYSSAEFPHRQLISSGPEWVEGIVSTAGHLLNEFFFEANPPEILERGLVAEILGPLRKFFTGYTIYAMMFPEKGIWERDPKVEEFFREAAIAMGSEGLILNPYGVGKLLDVIDPFPALRALADTPIAPPSVVFWTVTADVCVLPLIEATTFFRERILGALGDGIGMIAEILKEKSEHTRTKRILQMSDLHFGKPEAARRRRYLKGHLEDILDNIDRVVITGDLFDEPDVVLRDEFEEFRSDVERMTQREIIVIPGNHDVRYKGNKIGSFGSNFEQLANLRWEPIVVDDDLRAVFFCFNSAEGGDFARGLVSERQRLDRAAEYQRLKRKAGKIEDYLKIALVHHHPYAYDAEPEPTMGYQKLIAAVFDNEDVFLEFENADQFLNWCSDRGVSLILHGHKHRPRYKVGQEGILVIGCGSSTGVENSPMCYDVVTYDPETARWSVAFYHDPAADGSGFKLQSVMIDNRPAN